MNNTTQFITAISQSGLTPPDYIVDDGLIHRFSSNGKPGDKAGWYTYDSNGVTSGCFGCWRSGFDQTWTANIGRKLTKDEYAINKERTIAMQLKREAEVLKNQTEAQVKAKEFWHKGEKVVSHTYLTKKGVEAHGIKQLGNALIIPMLMNGEIASIEYIYEDGRKSRLPNGRVKGCYHTLGTPKDVIRFAEGYATGASIHEATGDAVVITFGINNLLEVTNTMHTQYPSMKLIICADDDESGVGIKKANEAASLVGATVVIPNFGENRPEKMKDFNDLHQLLGLDVLKAQLKALPARSSDLKLAVASIYKIGPQSAPEKLPSLPDVMPFDYNFLPEVLRRYVKDISERMQCPPDFAAAAVLVMISTIIGRKVGIRPMKHNDWTVIVNLWAALVGSSGVMKSPTQNAALAEIKKLQAKAYEAFNNAVAESEAHTEIAKMNESINKAEAKKLLSKDRSANVKNLLQASASNEYPILKRYITNNATFEALGELLMENPNGLLVEADEIIGLLKQLDSGGQEPARAFYLTAADGDKGYTFDRIMRGKGLHIPAVCLSVIGGIQPGVLAEYVRQATNGGAGADGLLQRFGLMVYPDISPIWTEVDRRPDGAAKQAVAALAEWLDNLNPLTDTKTESDDFSNVAFMRFDDKAQALFSEWRANLEMRLRSGEEHPAIVSHLSKYRKLIPSLALINHLSEYGKGAVTEKSLLRAIAYSEYLESHARRIYSSATRPDIDSAKTILNKLQGGKLSNPFKARDIYRACWTGVETPEKAQAAINLLVEYNHLFLEDVETGGRPTAYYHLNKVEAI